MQPFIIATEASEYFGRKIAEKIGGLPVSLVRSRFGDGERYYRINQEARTTLMGRNVVIVGSTHTDEDFLEICRVGETAAKGGARRVIYAIPFFGYSTMERAVNPGEIVTAKWNARTLSGISSGDERNVFLFLDLHTAGLIHYFEGTALAFELYAEPVLTEAIRELSLQNFIFASADLGRPRWVETFANIFGTDIAFIRKTRDFESTEVKTVIGEVAGKNILIYDDMVRSGKSLVKAAEAYIACGAKSVSAAVSHLAFTGEVAANRILASPIQKIVGTNSHPMSQLSVVQASGKCLVLDVAEVFADAISRILARREEL